MTDSAALLGVAAYDRGAAAPARVERALFDPLRTPILPGITLVEASAGTGKTFCITLTVLRLLLERREDGAYRVGDVSRILVVTFTVAATDELITRVRAALRRAVDVFAGIETARSPENDFLFALRDMYGAGELPRLRDALARLDELSIFTIHGFCKRVLGDCALESGTPYGADFVEDEDDLVVRAAQDWWRRTLFEDDLLAGIAVAEEWSAEDFGAALKLWRRHPDTLILPEAQPVADALRSVDEACRTACAEWQRAGIGALFDTVKWLSPSPLRDPAARAADAAAIAGIAAGRIARGLAALRRCTTDALLDEKKGVQKASRPALAAADPFMACCDAAVEAVSRLRHAHLCAFIHSVHDACDREKRSRHLLGFDDLLRRLCTALTTGGADGELARAIRARYDAALIDEFQDTDPFQFPIFTTAFAERPLLLIGDPKQAIYSFRGADIFAYMRAAERADRRFTLHENWRSTPALLRAFNALFTRVPQPFLQSEAAIPYVEVVAGRDDAGPLAEGAALQWWFVPPVPDSKGVLKCVGKGEARGRFERAMAAEVVQLLSPHAGGPVRVRPADIAVLVRTGREARAAQEALRAAGVPSIVSGAGSVMESDEMAEVTRLLTAVAAPTDGSALRAALATSLWGWEAHRIHALSRPEGDGDWQRLVDQLVAARETWLRHGLMRMAQEFVARERVAERLLGCDDGERRLTNLRHVVELVHAAAVEDRLSPEGVLLWIARARAERVVDAERAELRLESDADAVQIVTIHKSKGLEYGVVFCSCLWNSRALDDALLVHRDDGSVVFDHSAPHSPEHAELAAAERLAEDLRLAYVALTRAKYRCYVGWGAIAYQGTGSSGSALGYLLRPTADLDEHLPERLPAVVRAHLDGTIGEWQGALEALVAGSGGTMACTLLTGSEDEAGRWEPEVEAAVECVAREYDGAPGQLESWRVVSYTHLTRGSHDGGDADDGRDVADPEGEPPVLVRQPAGIHAFAKGRRAGVALHSIFEHLAFGDAEGPDTRSLVEHTLQRDRLVRPGEPGGAAAVDDVVTMVRRVVAAPLPHGGFRLADVAPHATLREWTFHLPLARVTTRIVEDVFATHGVGGPAAAYAPHLRALDPAAVGGFLIGVVDLALEHDGRWYVLDWKSNYLGPTGDDYGRETMEREMFDNHYTLQYHLYVLALHRFLQTRLPEYDYDRHMGGVWYVFLRGVDGASERGWYHDRPPRALIEALDAALVQDALVRREGIA